MSTRLIISAIAPNQPGMANRIARLIQESGATIVESHMTVMSKEFAVIMSIEGPWNALAKLEHQLPSKAQQLGMLTTLKRTENITYSEQLTAYRIVINSVDDPSIISCVTEFFAEHKINIEEINYRTCLAPHSETKSSEMKFTVTINPDQDFETLRSKFQQFCKTYNLDANISLLKNLDQ